MSNPREHLLFTYIFQQKLVTAKACLMQRKKENQIQPTNKRYSCFLFSFILLLHLSTGSHWPITVLPFFFFIFKYNQPLPLCLPPSPPCNFNSQINRLEREASSLRKRIFTLRVNKSKFIAGSEKDLKLTAVILELDSVLQLKNRQLLDIRLGTSL